MRTGYDRTTWAWKKHRNVKTSIRTPPWIVSDKRQISWVSKNAVWWFAPRDLLITTDSRTRTSYTARIVGKFSTATSPNVTDGTSSVPETTPSILPLTDIRQLAATLQPNDSQCEMLWLCRQTKNIRRAVKAVYTLSSQHLVHFLCQLRYYSEVKITTMRLLYGLLLTNYMFTYEIRISYSIQYYSCGETWISKLVNN